MTDVRDKRKVVLSSVVWAWIFIPSAILTGWATPRSYLWDALPSALTWWIVLLYGGLAWLTALAFVSLGTKGMWARAIFLLLHFLVIFQGMFLLGYFFAAGRRFDLADLLLLQNNFAFLFRYLFETEPRSLLLVLVVVLTASQIAWWHLGLAAGNLRSPATENVGPLLRQRQVHLRMLAGVAMLVGLSLVAMTRRYRASKTEETHSYFAWCLRGLAEIHPVLAYLDSLVPLWPEPRSKEPSDLSIMNPETYRGLHPPKLDRAKLRNLVVIQVESMRYDLIGQKVEGKTVMPFMTSLAEKSLNFRRAYANSSHTSYAALCVPLGLYPLRSRLPFFYRPDDPHPRVMLHDLLKPFGYRTLFFSSQFEPWGGMDGYWKTAGLDKYFDSTSARGGADSARTLTFFDFLRNRQHYAGNVDDAVTVGEFLRYLDEHPVDREPLAAFVFLENGHFPYPLPQGFDGAFQPSAIDFPISFFDFPKEKLSIVRNAYWNSMAYMDSQLRRLYQGLLDRKLADDMIFVVLGDHGEDLFEAGEATHAGALSDPVLHIPLIIHDRWLAHRVVDCPLSQVDVAPSLLGLLGLQLFPGHQGVNVLSLPADRMRKRPLFFHANASVNQDGIMLWPWKLLIDRKTGESKLFHLELGETQAGDQSQAYPMIAEMLRHHLNEFRQRQLEYYSNQKLFRYFFPPKYLDLTLPETKPAKTVSDISQDRNQEWPVEEPGPTESDGPSDSVTTAPASLRSSEAGSCQQATGLGRFH